MENKIILSNMEKNFVTYNQALALKELGFDEPTLLCYDKCDMLSSYVETVFKPKNYNTSGYVKSAPTIAEVVMWLYEKHGIWIDVRYMDDVLGFGFCVTTLEDNTEHEEVYNYNSPTEAYSQAIEYTLKNLI